MKLCLFGLPDLPRGKINLKDPRLDQADRLVQARKKTYAQVDAVGEDQLPTADAILTTHDGALELIFKDHDFVATRLDRQPDPAERAALLRLKAELEADRTVREAHLTPAERQALAIHRFHTAKPVIAATGPELADPQPLFLRAFRQAGYICFLTVGGKENRAWPIRAGSTAWEAAGVIHSDIQKGFIRAEIIPFADLVAAGGETGAKRAGRLRLETKSYVMQDCDVANFRFNR